MCQSWEDGYYENKPWLTQQATTWANAPAAANNTGVIVPITDVSEKGYDLFISNGTRWYPLSGYVDLALWRTKITVEAADSNKTTPNAVSVLKVTIPYSATNGSLIGNGDTVQFMLTHERSSGGSGTVSRGIYLGTNASAPLSNTKIDERNNTSTTNIYVVEDPAFMRVSSTSVNFIGRKNLDPVSGPTSTDVNDDADTVTGIASMDANTMYLDIVLQHASSVAEQLIFDYGLVRLYATGPVTG